MYCSACGASYNPGASYCAACGVRLAPGPAFGPAAASLTTVEPRRLGAGDWIALGATVVLLVFLYLPWYSIQIAFSSFDANQTFGSISALGDGAGGWRFLIFVCCLLIFGYLFWRTVLSRQVRLPLPHWQLLTVLTSLNLLLTLLAFLVKPGGGTSVAGLSFTWAYGAYVGLAAAAVAVAGAVLRRRDPEQITPERTTSVHPLE